MILYSRFSYWIFLEISHYWIRFLKKNFSILDLILIFRYFQFLFERFEFSFLRGDRKIDDII